MAREMPMCEPPRKWMRLTPSMVSGVTCSMSPLHQPLEAVAHADDVHALEGRADGRGADDAVDAGGGSAADEDGEFPVTFHARPLSFVLPALTSYFHSCTCSVTTLLLDGPASLYSQVWGG